MKWAPSCHQGKLNTVKDIYVVRDLIIFSSFFQPPPQYMSLPRPGIKSKPELGPTLIHCCHSCNNAVSLTHSASPVFPRHCQWFQSLFMFVLYVISRVLGVLSKRNRESMSNLSSSKQKSSCFFLKNTF